MRRIVPKFCVHIVPLFHALYLDSSVEAGSKVEEAGMDLQLWPHGLCGPLYVDLKVHQDGLEGDRDPLHLHLPPEHVMEDPVTLLHFVREQSKSNRYPDASNLDHQRECLLPEPRGYLESSIYAALSIIISKELKQMFSGHDENPLWSFLFSNIFIIF